MQGNMQQTALCSVKADRERGNSATGIQQDVSDHSLRLLRSVWIEVSSGWQCRSTLCRAGVLAAGIMKDGMSGLIMIR